MRPWAWLLDTWVWYIITLVPRTLVWGAGWTTVERDIRKVPLTDLLHHKEHKAQHVWWLHSLFISVNYNNCRKHLICKTPCSVLELFTCTFIYDTVALTCIIMLFFLKSEKYIICLLDHADQAPLANIYIECLRRPEKPLILGRSGSQYVAMVTKM